MSGIEGQGDHRAIYAIHYLEMLGVRSNRLPQTERNVRGTATPRPFRIRGRSEYQFANPQPSLRFPLLRHRIQVEGADRSAQDVRR